VIILDTNVLSALMRQKPEEAVVTWLDRQPRSSIWITSITVLEIRFGLDILAKRKRRRMLNDAFGQLLEKLEKRVLAFDADAAVCASDLMGMRQRKGRPGDLRDMMIAGIVLAQNGKLATRNVAHFEDAGIQLVNPWTEA
jgi:predicted nucleic acid-binding protein